MNIVGIIPARFASTRFPGKPLAMISGKTLIERVWRQAKKSKKLTDIIIATDDQRIFDAAQSFGAKAVMTSKNCKSGTDRLAEAVKTAAKGAQIIINIQGDEPVISPRLVDKIAGSLQKDRGLVAATAAFPLKDRKELLNPNVVKVVFDKEFNALYFSRYPIPYPRHRENCAGYYKHIGIYGYRRDFLLKFALWGQTPLEMAEQLEQLRILEKGGRLKVVICDRDSFGVDVPADIRKIERLIK